MGGGGGSGGGYGFMTGPLAFTVQRASAYFKMTADGGADISRGAIFIADQPIGCPPALGPVLADAHLFMLDGTCLTLPDSPANQAQYPPGPHQKPGCSFPLLRLVGVFCLKTGSRCMPTIVRPTSQPIMNRLRRCSSSIRRYATKSSPGWS